MPSTAARATQLHNLLSFSALWCVALRCDAVGAGTERMMVSGNPLACMHTMTIADTQCGVCVWWGRGRGGYSQTSTTHHQSLDAPETRPDGH
uniref:Putative secreted protein n=1 Tax=Anopheles marajoara TaxID=58244 RepID=A0A2M4C9P5_9DIPT